MYSMGIPIGVFVDGKGPRPAVILGAILLAVGYYPLHLAYNAGKGSVAWMCLVSYLSGLGGCMAFAAAIKTSAINWPHHRGTATAFPLAAFGLSAFFFSMVGSIFFPGTTGRFLLVLTCGTSGLTVLGFFFLRVLPPPSHPSHSSHPSHYHAISPTDDPDMMDSQLLHRTTSQESKSHRAGRGNPNEPGMSPNNVTNTARDASDLGNEATTSRETPSPNAHRRPSDAEAAAGTASTAAAEEVDETSSLVSRSRSSSASSLPGEVLVQSSVDMDRSHRVDIRGAALLGNIEFWQLFIIMGILSGIGLMTIK